jgi:hypothetical protein
MESLADLHVARRPGAGWLFCENLAMSEEGEKDAPSLEPPSLFRRKKKPPKAPPEPPPDPAPEPPAPLLEETAPVVDDTPATIFDDTSEPTPDVPAPAPTPASTEPRPPREPWLGGTPAAALTGLFIGALIVAATAGSLHLCTALKGTSSCGGPGFFLLVAILVVAVLLGAAMLRAARVPEPTSTSFLAVGLLSVVALLFLVGSIFEWWMAIVIPLASVATFLLSYWVTTTFIDPADDGKDPAVEPESHDVR